MNQLSFKNEVRDEFFKILDYWTHYSIDEDKGGFFGAIDLNNKPIKSEKSCVVTARILWSFSNAITFINENAELHIYSNRLPKYEAMAQRAFLYLTEKFWDHENGGVFWNVDEDGRPLETKKQMYAHSFFVYAMSEYNRAIGYKSALEYAKKCFDLILKHAYDNHKGGYFEAFDKNWGETNDYILSKDEAKKSMNTTLHLLEAITNLYRVLPKEDVRFHLQHALETMLNKIVAADYRMKLFFKSDWTVLTQTRSYGHDIEASWLIMEAAEVLQNTKLINQAHATCIEMAKIATEGLQSDHGMIYEYEPDTGHQRTNRDWWVMAEAMVGFYNAYELSGKVHFLDKAEKSWEFIKTHLIDHQNGEWFAGVDDKHQVLGKTKVNPWKAPYHNSRACYEIYRRLKG